MCNQLEKFHGDIYWLKQRLCFRLKAHNQPQIRKIKPVSCVSCSAPESREENKIVKKNPQYCIFTRFTKCVLTYF